MKRVLILDLDLFEPRCGGGIQWSEDIMHKLLEILAFANLTYLQCNPNTPSVYAAGVRYIKEPPDQELFQSIPSVMRSGGADCEDLAAWRIAELRAHGEAAKFVIQKFVPKSGMGPLVFHILVLRGDGKTVEDPSKALGMKGSA